MIKNIVFDMGQVLIYFRPDLLLERLGVSEEDRPMLVAEIFKKVEWIQLDRGTISEEDAVKSICTRLPERFHGIVYDTVTGWWKRPIVPVPGMKELIRELKEKGYKIYLLSNANDKQILYHDKIPGTEYFDGRIVSAEHKVIKPQPELYHILFDTYDLKPEECVFIDDVAMNIEAGINVGMQGIIFENNLDKLRADLAALGVR